MDGPRKMGQASCPDEQNRTVSGSAAGAGEFARGSFGGQEKAGARLQGDLPAVHRQGPAPRRHHADPQARARRQDRPLHGREPRHREAAGLRGPDQFLLGRGKPPGRDLEHFRHSGGVQRRVVEDLQRQVRRHAHETRLGRNLDPLAHELAPDDQVGRLHDFQHQDALADGVRQPARDEPDIADPHRYRVEAGVHGGDVLFEDDAPPLPRRRRPLESQANVRVALVTQREDDVSLQFSPGRAQVLTGEGGGGMGLHVQPHRRVEQLGQKAGARAETRGVFPPEVVIGVVREKVLERGPLAGRGTHRRQPLVGHGGHSRVNGAHGGCEPIFRAVAVAGFAPSLEAVEQIAAAIIAPHAVRPQGDQGGVHRPEGSGGKAGGRSIFSFTFSERGRPGSRVQLAVPPLLFPVCTAHPSSRTERFFLPRASRGRPARWRRRMPRPASCVDPLIGTSPESHRQNRLHVRHGKRVSRRRLSTGDRGLESRYHSQEQHRRGLLVSRRQDRGFQPDPLQRTRRAVPERRRLRAVGPAGRRIPRHRLGNLRLGFFPRQRERAPRRLPRKIRQRPADGTDRHAAHGNGPLHVSGPRRRDAAAAGQRRGLGQRQRGVGARRRARRKRRRLQGLFLRPVLAANQKRQDVGGRGRRRRGGRGRAKFRGHPGLRHRHGPGVARARGGFLHQPRKRPGQSEAGE